MSIKLVAVVDSYYERECFSGYKVDHDGLNISLDECKDLASILLERKIKCVAGQVASGACLAFALQVASNHKLKAFVLKKSGYDSRKHSSFSSRINTKDKYIIIDDVVSSGHTMLYSLKDAKKFFLKNQNSCCHFIGILVDLIEL